MRDSKSCPSPRHSHRLINTAVAPPNAGGNIISVDLPGNDYTNSELYVFTNKPSYETQWHAYETNPPSNPGWTTTLPVVTVNPKSVQRGPCFVKLRANRPVQFSTNPIGVTVVGGRRTKVRVVYP